MWKTWNTCLGQLMEMELVIIVHSIKTLGDWDVSNVTNMQSSFKSAEHLIKIYPTGIYQRISIVFIRRSGRRL